ncbi:hypothetical protein HaLaN_23203 [Haematococcus lacustris]|uniref:Uncharacterized protein n=1 Tax=Haematococcus lacustris TaxID=44745 RepID=A0A6A0A122_HAELA|nr:hypothetical protein HaLaN_23203 [Haematococcus lacustris]
MPKGRSPPRLLPTGLAPGPDPAAATEPPSTDCLALEPAPSSDPEPVWPAPASCTVPGPVEGPSGIRPCPCWPPCSQPCSVSLCNSCSTRSANRPCCRAASSAAAAWASLASGTSAVRARAATWAACSKLRLSRGSAGGVEVSACRRAASSAAHWAIAGDRRGAAGRGVHSDQGAGAVLMVRRAATSRLPNTVSSTSPGSTHLSPDTSPTTPDSAKALLAVLQGVGAGYSGPKHSSTAAGAGQLHWLPGGLRHCCRVLACPAVLFQQVWLHTPHQGQLGHQSRPHVSQHCAQAATRQGSAGVVELGPAALLPPARSGHPLAETAAASLAEAQSHPQAALPHHQPSPRTAGLEHAVAGAGTGSLAAHCQSCAEGRVRQPPPVAAQPQSLGAAPAAALPHCPATQPRPPGA